MRFLHTTAVFACLVFASSSLSAQLERNIEESPSARIIPRTERFVVSAGVGLLPTFIGGGTQQKPVINTTALYYVTTRLGLGVGFAQSSTKSDAYVDENGVQSWSITDITHVGARLSGTIVQSGPLELYGGLQIGMNSTKASYEHMFPETLNVESETEYIATRPNPFGEPRSQLSTIGFFGVSVKVLPHVHVMSEIGNNLSLLTAGLEVRF